MLANNPFAGLMTRTMDGTAAPRQRPERRIRVWDTPWKLVPAERRLLIALVKCGSLAVAGREIGINARSAETYAADIRKKMEAKTTLIAVLTWDRFTRASND